MAMRRPKTAIRGRERELAARLAAGQTYAEAGKALGMSERTISRCMTRSEFRALVDAIRDERVEAVVGSLGDASAEAIATLRRLLAEQSPMVRLGAVRTILEFLLRGREHVDLARRVADLERSDESAGPGEEAGSDADRDPDGPADAGSDPERSDGDPTPGGDSA